MDLFELITLNSVAFAIVGIVIGCYVEIVDAYFGIRCAHYAEYFAAHIKMQSWGRLWAIFVQLWSAIFLISWSFVALTFLDLYVQTGILSTYDAVSGTFYTYLGAFDSPNELKLFSFLIICGLVGLYAGYYLIRISVEVLYRKNVFYRTMLVERRLADVQARLEDFRQFCAEKGFPLTAVSHHREESIQ